MREMTTERGQEVKKGLELLGMHWHVENKYARYSPVKSCETFCRFGISLSQFVWSSPRKSQKFRTCQYIFAYKYRWSRMTNACANDVATARSLFDVIKRHVISISREIYAKILRLNDHII